MKVMILRLAIVLALLAGLPLYAHVHELPAAESQTPAEYTHNQAVDQPRTEDSHTGHSQNHEDLEPPLHCGASGLVTEAALGAYARSATDAPACATGSALAAANPPEPPPPRG